MKREKQAFECHREPGSGAAIQCCKAFRKAEQSDVLF
jgi:hypothetical protein